MMSDKKGTTTTTTRDLFATVFLRKGREGDEVERKERGKKVFFTPLVHLFLLRVYKC